MAIKALTISDHEEIILALQDEIRRSPEARYDHRLHGVLLVAHGLSCREVARRLGDAPRSVQNWVHRFDQHGFAGLADGERQGRPSRLTSKQREQVEEALRRSPSHYGLPAQLWDGPLLSSFLKRQLRVTLQVRQCQRLFRRLGFRLRTPRPEVGQAEPAAQAAVKKTPGAGRRSGG